MTKTPPNALLKPLLNSPLLPLLAQELAEHIAEERRSRQEFYDHITEDMKAEFINGQMVLHSPVTDSHEYASTSLCTLMNVFVVLRDLGRVLHEKAMISLTRNDFEPDICFFRAEKAAEFLPNQKQYPAPDLVVEVLSKSTEKIDRGIKMQDYAAHGVGEYWLVDTQQQLVEQYILQDGSFVRLPAMPAGRIRSYVIPKFEIPLAAIFDAEIFKQTLAQLSVLDSSQE